MSPADFTAELESLRGALAEAQANARRLRSEAFVRYVPVVAGVRLEPLTLDRYNRLVAFENAYVVGGSPRVEDLLVFIWVCSARFGQFAEAERRACYRTVLRALRPRHPVLGPVARVLCPLSGLWRRLLSGFICEDEASLLQEADGEVRRLVAEALGDFPRDDSKGEPLPFAFQAQILNMLRRELGVSFDEARALPMKELAQHVRELVHTASRGRAQLLTPAEARVWLAYEALADRAAASEQPASS